MSEKPTRDKQHAKPEPAIGTINIADLAEIVAHARAADPHVAELSFRIDGDTLRVV